MTMLTFLEAAESSEVEIDLGSGEAQRAIRDEECRRANPGR